MRRCHKKIQVFELKEFIKAVHINKNKNSLVGHIFQNCNELPGLMRLNVYSEHEMYLNKTYSISI